MNYTTLDQAAFLNVTSGNYNIIQANKNVSVPEPPDYILFNMTLFCSLLFICGVGGNLLVIFVVLRNAHMRSYTNCLLTNLSVSDLLVLVICMPTAVVDLFAKEVWYLGAFMCKLVPFLEHSVYLTSVLTILAISLERYSAICRPLHTHSLCSPVRMMQVVPTIWITAFGCCTPHIFITVYKDSKFVDGTPIKVCRTYMRHNWHYVYAIVMLGLFFVIPFFIILGIYTKIGKTLARESCPRELSRNCGSSDYIRRRRQVIKMLGTVVFFFFSSHLSIQVVRLWLVYSKVEDRDKLGFEGFLNLVAFCRLTFYFNSAVNPICFYIISSKFRNAFKQALCCGNSKYGFQHPTFGREMVSSNGGSNRYSSKIDTSSSRKLYVS